MATAQDVETYMTNHGYSLNPLDIPACYSKWESSGEPDGIPPPPIYPTTAAAMFTDIANRYSGPPLPT